MNTALIQTEIWVLLIGLAALLFDLWLPASKKSTLGYYVAALLSVVLYFHFKLDVESLRFALAQDSNLSKLMTLDGTSIFLKRIFLASGVLISIISCTYSKRFKSGVGEYFVILVFALLGMLFAASARHFSMMFVSIELITVSFYVLVSFNRNLLASIEAGIKFLILGALSSSILIFGMALIYASAGSMDLSVIKSMPSNAVTDPVFLLGFILLFSGLCFKVAVVPFQFWAPDVYQGAPTPTTSFLAIGSKAAGVVLMLRVVYEGLPTSALFLRDFLFGISILTILYGNLCAIPQKNIKRLLGYSSIANGGYILMGIASMNPSGVEGVLVYLAAYMFAVIGAFSAICFLFPEGNSEEISSIAGLQKRSTLLSVVLTFSMVSLAGIPPLAGFFGKFFIFKATLEATAFSNLAWITLGVAILGVMVSIFYYFGVIRQIYWPDYNSDQTPVKLSFIQVAVLVLCVAGILWLGIMPASIIEAAKQAAVSFW